MNISFTRFHFLAIVSLVLVWAVALTCRDSVYDNIRQYFSESNKPKTSQTTTGVMIKDKVAVITDTQFNSRTLPLILHFHAVLGPSWPILFYTSPETYREHFSLNATSKTGTSAVWRRAVEQREIEVRIIDKQFDLTQRQGVNLYLSKPWFWNQLAPAKSVLIFQADAMLCANSRKTMDDFLKYDFIGAVFDPKKHLYNGGLSLRNRTMTLEILNSGRDWEKEVKAGKWDSKAGEDVWFSAIMDKRGGKMPPVAEALDFSHEFEWQVDGDHKPLGYHKVHKYASKKLDKIRAWCPEIDLAAPGKLADDPRR